MKAHLIQPGQILGETIEVTDDLDALQRLVGGFLQGIPLRPDVMAYVDEEGKMKGKRVNHAATVLCRPRLLPGDVIVGPCLVVGVDGESLAPLPPAWRDL